MKAGSLLAAFLPRVETKMKAQATMMQVPTPPRIPRRSLVPFAARLTQQRPQLLVVPKPKKKEEKKKGVFQHHLRLFVVSDIIIVHTNICRRPIERTGGAKKHLSD